MKNYVLRGHLEFEEKEYTFLYEDGKLTLISTDVGVYGGFNFNCRERINAYLEGVTLSGNFVVFLVEDLAEYDRHKNHYVFFPTLVLIDNGDIISNTMKEKYDSLYLSGGILNYFFGNYHMIDVPEVKDDSVVINKKKMKETEREESVNILNIDSIWQLSISEAGYNFDNRSYVFGTYDTLLRVKFTNETSYKDIIQYFYAILNFFRVISNRYNNDVCFNEIYLETLTENKKYRKSVIVLAPCMIDKKPIKYCISYDSISGKINALMNFIKDFDYIFQNMPKSDEDFNHVSAKDYSSIMSCFQALYSFTNNEEPGITEEEKETIEVVRKDILKAMNDKLPLYSGDNKVFLERLIHLVESANTKLSKMLKLKIKENEFLIDTLYAEERNYFKSSKLKELCDRAVRLRDDITHNGAVKLDEFAVAMYVLIYRLIYAMMLDYIGLSKEQIHDIINSLRRRSVI